MGHADILAGGRHRRQCGGALRKIDAAAGRPRAPVEEGSEAVDLGMGEGLPTRVRTAGLQLPYPARSGPWWLLPIADIRGYGHHHDRKCLHAANSFRIPVVLGE